MRSIALNLKRISWIETCLWCCVQQCKRTSAPCLKMLDVCSVHEKALTSERFGKRCGIFGSMLSVPQMSHLGVFFKAGAGWEQKGGCVTTADILNVQPSRLTSCLTVYNSVSFNTEDKNSSAPPHSPPQVNISFFPKLLLFNLLHTSFNETDQNGVSGPFEHAVFLRAHESSWSLPCA